jgi:5-methylcytosine-specific restriction endonuclease McrA
LAESSICWICGEAGADQVDHVIPVADLPPDDPLLTDKQNLRPAHGDCNRRRANGTLPAPMMRTSRNWLGGA